MPAARPGERADPVRGALPSQECADGPRGLHPRRAPRHPAGQPRPLDDRIIIQTHTGAALLSPAQDGAVVAYETDALDPVMRTGSSVVVTGVARLVKDAAQQERYAASLQHWVAGTKDQMISISIDMVTGYRIA
ncbi:pyridoxamine 5'-phosphate oxidase family protein [Streptomyces sp. 21So2-11]|uniref:pyridoxamine 5'-phosphate oxidase family protein n=1 Tax=Streptomyces sp. 21So2-11 TaxID=3144408 RepID=UPI003219B338